MTDREDDFDRTAKDSEGRKVQQELERQLRELGDTMSDSFRHGFEGRGEEIGDRVWDVGRAAVNAAGYGISEAGRAFQAGKQEYQKRAEEARGSAGASGMTDSRFCRRKVLAISADMRSSNAVVRPVLISWWKSYRSRKKVART